MFVRIGLGIIGLGFLLFVVGASQTLADSGDCHGVSMKWDAYLNRYVVTCAGPCAPPKTCDEEELQTDVDQYAYFCTCDGTIVDGDSDCRPWALKWKDSMGAWHSSAKCFQRSCFNPCPEDATGPDANGLYTCPCP